MEGCNDPINLEQVPILRSHSRKRPLNVSTISSGGQLSDNEQNKRQKEDTNSANHPDSPSFSTRKVLLYISLDSTVQVERQEGATFLPTAGEAVIQFLSKLYLQQIPVSNNTNSNSSNNNNNSIQCSDCVELSPSLANGNTNGKKCCAQHASINNKNDINAKLATFPATVDQGVLLSHLFQNTALSSRLVRASSQIAASAATESSSSSSLSAPLPPPEHFTRMQWMVPLHNTISTEWTNPQSGTTYRIVMESAADKHHKTAITNHRYEVVLRFQPAITNEALRTLFNVAYEEVLQRNKQDKSEVDMYCYDDDGWYKQCTLKKRSLDSIYLPKATKESTLAKIDDFLASREYYDSNHIPYKLVFLLWGVSGAGKTSFVQSIASHYDFNLAHINFTRKMDDAAFIEALADIPNDSILLIEDIDSLGFGAARDQRDNDTQLSLSCILNALDGVTRGKVRLVFMTCNEKKRLSSAFIRPGRIDILIPFDTIRPEEITAMFRRLVAADKHHQLAEFLHKIRSLSSNLTPAILQKFFVDKRHCSNLVDELPYLKQILNEIAKERNPLTDM
jgi:hypothetical protein